VHLVTLAQLRTKENPESYGNHTAFLAFPIDLAAECQLGFHQMIRCGFSNSAFVHETVRSRRRKDEKNIRNPCRSNDDGSSLWLCHYLREADKRLAAHTFWRWRRFRGSAT
jgi:hypothetical protein